MTTPVLVFLPPLSWMPPPPPPPPCSHAGSDNTKHQEPFRVCRRFQLLNIPDQNPENLERRQVLVADADVILIQQNRHSGFTAWTRRTDFTEGETKV